MIELSVFLGNPGKRYENTRHNVAMRLGAAAVERANEQFQSKFQGLIATLRAGAGGPGSGVGSGAGGSSGVGTQSSGARAGGSGGKMFVLLPQTYMNRSGESAGACARYHGIAASEVLVAHDEVELPFGTVELRRGGGLAGHNGLRSVSSHLSSKDFARLRIGIGRPRHGNVSPHVLGNFSPDEVARLDELERAVSDILDRLLIESFDAVSRSTGRRVVFEW